MMPPACFRNNLDKCRHEPYSKSQQAGTNQVGLENNGRNQWEYNSN